MSTYKATLPSHPVPPLPPSIPIFFAHFYATSDNLETHTQYADAFTPTATLIMGTRSFTGHESILAFRKSIWAGIIVSRLHTLEKIVPFGETHEEGQKGWEVMLYGDVKYGLKGGGDLVVDWAGRAVLVPHPDGGEDGWRMKFYQVYLDSAPAANAAKEIQEREAKKA